MMKNFSRLLAALVLFVIAAPAAIQYSGTAPVNQTFTLASGTRLEFVTGMSDCLVAAGWSVVSGAGTGDVKLQTATTPQSLAARVRLYDSGSSNYASVYLMNTAETVKQTNAFRVVTNVAGTVYRCIANKYQFFVFQQGNTPVDGYVAGGVPWVPSFLSASITELIWGSTNGRVTADSNLYESFRTSTQICNAGYSIVYANAFYDVNANQWGSSNSSETQVGCGRLVAPGQMFDYDTNGMTPVTRWHDDSAFIAEPLIAWGQTAASEAKVRGQLWDAAVITDSFTGDLLLTFDSRNWYTLTNNNLFVAGTKKLGTLVLVVP